MRGGSDIFGKVAGRQSFAELLRYGAASAIALAADFTTLVLLTELSGVHYLAAAAAGFGLGVFVVYLLSIRWVFATRRLADTPAECVIFLLIGLAGLVINHFVMYGLTEGALLPYAISKIGSVGLVFAFNFSVRKVVLFTAPALPRV